MMEKHEIAVKQFMKGFRCSQAVLDVYAHDFDVNPELAKKLSLGLAGGSGVGGECGAVSAAYLVIGLKYGFTHPGDPEKFNVIINKNRSFVEKFKSLHKEIDCQKLINLDVFSKQGHQQFLEKNIKASMCKQFVGDTVKILDQIIKE